MVFCGARGPDYSKPASKSVFNDEKTQSFIKMSIWIDFLFVLYPIGFFRTDLNLKIEKYGVLYSRRTLSGPESFFYSS